MQRHLEALRAFYGPLPAPPGEVFACAVWELLSAGTMPVRRDQAWQALRRVPALTPDALFRTATKTLHQAVALAGGSADERLDRLRAVAGEFRRHRARVERMAQGLLPAARAVWRLPHLSGAMRARLLLFAGGYPVIALDGGAARVVTRLFDESAGRTAPRLRLRRARRRLAAEVPMEMEVRRALALYLPYHAARACTETLPHCTVCPLRPHCAWGGRAS